MNRENVVSNHAFLINPLNSDQLNNYGHYYEYGSFLNDNYVTENDLQNAPDKIDGLSLSNADKVQLLTDVLEFDSRGVFYSINDSNQIVRHQLNESLEIEKSLVLMEHVEISMTEKR